MNRRDFVSAAAPGWPCPHYMPPIRRLSRAVSASSAPAGTASVRLFRLIQVAPVEVVSLCDVDKQCSPEAADMVGQRHASEKEAASIRRLPRDAQGEGPRHLSWSRRPTTGTRWR